MATMIVKIPFHPSLEHYPPGTTYEQALEQEAQALRDGVYSVDEFIGADPDIITVEVEL